jgi:heme O synthase-like polyprenyltransferase
MIPSTNTIMGNSAEINWKWTDVLMPVFTEFKTLIFGLLALIAVAVFIYLWYKLVTAQWKPDEFKKAMMGFVYAVVWLAIIPLAWAMIKLISSLQF